VKTETRTSLLQHLYARPTLTEIKALTVSKTFAVSRPRSRLHHNVHDGEAGPLDWNFQHHDTDRRFNTPIQKMTSWFGPTYITKAYFPKIYFILCVISFPDSKMFTCLFSPLPLRPSQRSGTVREKWIKRKERDKEQNEIRHEQTQQKQGNDGKGKRQGRGNKVEGEYSVS